MMHDGLSKTQPGDPERDSSHTKLFCVYHVTTMSSLFGALNLQGHRGQPTLLPAQANASTFYFRKSPLWARWALVLVSVDMILVCEYSAFVH